MTKKYKEIKNRYNIGCRFLNDTYNLESDIKSQEELNKKPLRSEIINFLLASIGNEGTTYLEIGVRNPEDNFNKIISKKKISVDPGIEFKANPVDFKMTSDDFFKEIKNGNILSEDIKFDVVFIDGLHLAEQVERDINNSLNYIKDDGFIVLHDCNPPTEFHSRESFSYYMSPAKYYWNGTTWKAFFKFRQNRELYSCCINSDWGIGVISKNSNLGKPTMVRNPYYEYHILNEQRSESLNLIDYEVFKSKLSK
jgi:hypothetical protein